MFFKNIYIKIYYYYIFFIKDFLFDKLKTDYLFIYYFICYY